MSTDQNPHLTRVALIAQHLRDHRGHKGNVEQKDLDAADDLLNALEALPPEGTPAWQAAYAQCRADVMQEFTKAQEMWGINHGGTP